MNYSVGIVDIVVDADAVDDTGRIDLPSAAGIIRARRFFSPVGTVVDIAAAVAVDTARRGHVPRVVVVARARRS